MCLILSILTDLNDWKQQFLWTKQLSIENRTNIGTKMNKITRNQKTYVAIQDNTYKPRLKNLCTNSSLNTSNNSNALFTLNT